MRVFKNHYNFFNHCYEYNIQYIFRYCIDFKSNINNADVNLSISLMYANEMKLWSISVIIKLFSFIFKIVNLCISCISQFTPYFTSTLTTRCCATFNNIQYYVMRSYVSLSQNIIFSQNDLPDDLISINDSLLRNIDVSDYMEYDDNVSFSEIITPENDIHVQTEQASPLFDQRLFATIAVSIMSVYNIYKYFSGLWTMVIVCCFFLLLIHR